jgi:hypothetical protein
MDLRFGHESETPPANKRESAHGEAKCELLLNKLSISSKLHAAKGTEAFPEAAGQ